MKKIIIDARMLRWTGIGRYTQALLNELPALDQDNQYLVLLANEDFRTWRSKSPNFSPVEANYQPYSLREQTKMPAFLQALAPDLVHFTHFSAPWRYGGKRIHTIHDLTLIDFKTNRGHSTIEQLRYNSKHLAMRALFNHEVVSSKAILTPTQFVKDDIIRRFPNQPGLAAKIFPTLEAVSPLIASPKPVARLPKPFIFYAGNAYPNKNLGKLVESFGQIRQTHPELTLVISGREDFFSRQLQDEVNQLGDASAIRFTGFVNDHELAWLYQNAAAFVFPSLSEGFGLPPLEAMAAGAPVISSNATSLPEVLGEAAVYFDPTSTAEITKVVSETLADPKLLAELKTRGPKHAKQFSWRRMAEQTLAVYKKVLDQ